MTVQRLALLGAAAVALASAALADPLPPPALMFTAIEVSDLAKAEAFYGALGMKRLMRLSKPGDPFVKDALSFSGDPLSAEPLLILMHHDRPPNGHAKAAGLTIGLHVADAHVAAAQLRRAGYKVMHEPAADDRSAKLATLARDPDGNLVELVQLDLARMR